MKNFRSNSCGIPEEISGELHKECLGNPTRNEFLGISTSNSWGIPKEISEELQKKFLENSRRKGEGRSVTDHMFTLRTFLDNLREYNMQTHHLYIDSKAAYDFVKIKKNME